MLPYPWVAYFATRALLMRSSRKYELAEASAVADIGFALELQFQILKE